MNKIYSFSLLAGAIILLKSCASVAPPKGGEKDNERPKLVKTSPKNGTTNFKGKRITYTFNEWIQEDKLHDQIIISPSAGEFESKIVKNTLILTFDSSGLKPNTTYNINLRNGIKDLHEGMKADSTNLVFATGSLLDSLKIEGYAILGDEDKKANNILIGLYPASDTFRIEKEDPLYVSRTDSSSRFNIDNIKNGEYFLYAFKDDNNNGKYDKNKEYIGYIAQKIDLIHSLSISQINLFKEELEGPKVILKENKKRAIVRLDYNTDLTSAQVWPLNTNIKLYPLYKNKQLQLFTEEPGKDSVKFVVETTDIYNVKGRDTLGMIFNYTDTSKYTYQAVPNNNSAIEPNDSIEIFLNKPYKGFKNRLIIQNGKYVKSDNKLQDDFLIKMHMSKGSISIIPKESWKDTVRITVLPHAFEPVNGYLKDTLKLTYTLKDPETYGKIGGTVTTNAQHILVQLLSKDNRIVKQQKGKQFMFDYLTDGEYKLRAVIDKNMNNRWDQGDYRTRRPAEQIYYYQENIRLKTSWEILDLNLSFQTVD